MKELAEHLFESEEWEEVESSTFVKELPGRRFVTAWVGEDWEIIFDFEIRSENKPEWCKVFRSIETVAQLEGLMRLFLEADPTPIPITVQYLLDEGYETPFAGDGRTWSKRRKIYASARENYEDIIVQMGEKSHTGFRARYRIILFSKIYKEYIRGVSSVQELEEFVYFCRKRYLLEAREAVWSP